MKSNFVVVLRKEGKVKEVCAFRERTKSDVKEIVGLHLERDPSLAVETKEYVDKEDYLSQVKGWREWAGEDVVVY